MINYELISRSIVEVLQLGALKGTGWCAGPHLIVTAWHVVHERPDSIEVESVGLRRCKAVLIAGDRGHDLALLRVADLLPEVPSLKVSADHPKLGDEAFLVGSPFGTRNTVVFGKVSNLNRQFAYVPEFHCNVEHYIIAGQTPEGCSGGPWIDSTQQVIGLASAYMSFATQGKTVSADLCRTIPPSAIQNLLDKQSDIPTTSIGAAVQDLRLQSPALISLFRPGAEGVLVTILEPGGPAQLAGLVVPSPERPRYDIIIEADGRHIRMREDLLRVVTGKKPGDACTLTVQSWEKGEVRTFRCQINLGLK